MGKPPGATVASFSNASLSQGERPGSHVGDDHANSSLHPRGAETLWIADDAKWAVVTAPSPQLPSSAAQRSNLQTRPSIGEIAEDAKRRRFGSPSPSEGSPCRGPPGGPGGWGSRELCMSLVIVHRHRLTTLISTAPRSEDPSPERATGIRLDLLRRVPSDWVASTHASADLEGRVAFQRLSRSFAADMEP